ncbi:serine/threonine protein kinase [Fonticula alba]|uniref:Serine/threonine protein kinase n=1 Tax=Fonticula alba TaxID=691883 RepID=A0A058Z8C4_FONAL|nr:serine/threonine protein kinase [Fonticula alba]KCV70480.1 serine/threonine protein kinase [Fonticula alba]|eukprot:XP_009494996.1 serine/threonine protein kinase [Fonticula alba]
MAAVRPHPVAGPPPSLARLLATALLLLHMVLGATASLGGPPSGAPSPSATAMAASSGAGPGRLPGLARRLATTDCDPTCSSCFAPGPGNCHACLATAAEHVLFESDCVSVCPPGFAAAPGSGICLPCRATCATCAPDGQCTDCPAGRTLEATGACSPDGGCPAGTFSQGEGSPACASCHSSCLECAGPLATECLQCRQGDLFMPAGEAGSCRSPCPSGQFPLLHMDTNGPEYRCHACAAGCHTCRSSTACATCAPGLRLTEAGACRAPASCPDGFLNAGDEGDCQPCDDACATCHGPSSADCITCPADHLLFQGTCLSACPEGSFPQAGRCQPCHRSCLRCDGPDSTNCTACMGAGAPAPNGSGPCLAPCANGQFSDAGACRACDASCAACAGPGAADCTACHPDRLLREGRCEALCPVGFFADLSPATGPRCAPAHPSCVHATGPGADACTACDVGLLRADGLCQPACPAGSFPSEAVSWLGSSEGVCALCSTGCASCSDIDVCRACIAGFVLREHQSSGQVTCTDDCGSGHFADHANGRCAACHGSCAKCSGPGTCDTCAPGLVFVHSAPALCTDQCGAGRFANLSAGVCQSCAANCAACAGTAATCTACPAGKFLDPRTDGCVEDCGSSRFGDATTGSCAACLAGCGTCNDATSCEACLPGLVLDQQDGVTACSSDCAPGHFINLEAGLCQPCDTSCASCYGNAAACTGCPSGRFLDPVDDTCVEDCGSGRFADLAARRCAACALECAQCADSATACTACAPGFRPTGAGCTACPAGCAACSGSAGCDACLNGFWLDPGTGSCVVRCPDGLYADVSTGVCGPCHESCAACDGPAAGDCIVCPAGRFLWQGACLASCPAGSFAQADACQACHGSCVTCAGPADNQCTGCPPGHSLWQGACSGICPDGFFLEPATGACVGCDAACSACVGPQADQCTACPSADEWLVTDQTRCTADPCAVGYAALHRPRAAGAPDQALCLPCMVDGCAVCDEAAAEAAPPGTPACEPAADHPRGFACTQVPKCDRCQAGLALLSAATGGHRCVEACPDGFYLSPAGEATPAQCAPCAGACLLCDGPSSEDCIDDSSAAPPPANRTIGVGVGVGVGVTILLVGLLLVGLLLYRRRQQDPTRSKAGLEGNLGLTPLNTFSDLSPPDSVLVSAEIDFMMLEPLGEGLQASVSSARILNPQLRQTLQTRGSVAIKTYRDPASPAGRSAFHNEITILWTLREEFGILKLLAYSEQPRAAITELYYSCLATLLRSDLPLTPRAMLRIAVHFASGLAAVHTRGIVHRDIRPANILVRQSEDGSWNAVIGDFASSNVLSTLQDAPPNASRRAPALNPAAVPYSSPELLFASSQRRFLEYSALRGSDVFSAGMVLWCIFCRKLPWSGLKSRNIRQQVLAGERPSLAELKASLGGQPAEQAVTSLIERCWDVQPEGRPSARDILAQLAPFAPG